mmetsp:Transcript_46271/g.82669  ORF Transcript_46271/g.82669 Transcript_46271/m.82669 type:complete len:151 (-) Transcript_46271:840-1292(-)
MHNRSKSRRFISLVDELYRYKVKLVCTAAHQPDKLFSYEELTKAGSMQQSDDYYTYSTSEREQGRFFLDWENDFGDETSHCHRSNGSYLKEPSNDRRFTGAEEVFAFQRVESRLKEMITEEYLQLQHLLFTTTEVNVQILLNGTRQVGAG